MLRATLKGLLAHKLRLALTALAIVLGVGFVSGTYILTDTMNRAFDDLFREINKGVAVSVKSVPKFEANAFGETAGLGERIPASLVDEIRGVPGVRVAEGSLTGYAQIVVNGEAITTGGAPTLGVSSITDPELSGAIARDGRMPEREGEITVDAGTASRHGLRVGERVTVLLQGPPMEATIVGIFGFASADNLGGATVVGFDPRTAQEALNGGGRYDTIDVAAEPGVSPGELKTEIQRTLPPGIGASTGEEAAAESSGEIKQALSFFNIALLVFAGVALFVGAFIIFNTFQILVTQRTRELALLRALGASARQVRISVVVEALLVGLLASAVGLGFGFVIALGLQGLLTAFGIDLPSTTTQLLPRTIIVAFAVGVGTTAAASIVPAFRASGIPPVAALREAQPAVYVRSRRRTVAGLLLAAAGGGFLFYGLFGGPGNAAAFVGLGAGVVFLGVAVLSPLVAVPVATVLGAPMARLFGISGKLGRENAIRNPKRTASTAAALMIGLGLVGFVSIFAASVKASTARALEETLKADYIVTSDQFQGFTQDVATRLRELPELAAVSEFRGGLMGVDGRAQQVTGLDPETAEQVVNPELVSGTLTGLSEGQVMVHQDVATSNGWDLGGSITVEFARTGRRALTVAGIYADDRLLGDHVVSLDTFDRNFTEHLDVIVLARTAPGVSQGQAREAVARVARDFPHLHLEDQAEFRQTQAAQIDQLLGLITALLGLAIVIAFFGIINTLALSIYERTREIGLLRAVGMARRQVRSMIRWEAVIVAVFGALLGTAVGVFFGWAMVRALSDQGIDVLSVPAGQLILYIVIAGLFGVLAAIGPARRASRLDVLRAIATE